MKKTFYVTTPIYYPSGNLHIGHAYTTTIADIIARYKRQMGYDAFMLTGSDEHGQKIEEEALKTNMEPKAFVDHIVDSSFKPLFKALDIDYNIFMRTTNKWHEETIEKIFYKMLENGDIYKGEYEGLYCVKCEAFYTESQLGEGNICPDHGIECSLTKQESYMFKMSKYQDFIKELIENHGDKLASKSVQQELLNNFIYPGLQDLSLTRTNFTWGISLGKDPKHVIYVWLDALFNYITALGYRMGDNEENFDKFWNNGETLHIIGKDITRFHCIYWPIFLKSLDIKAPGKIITHGLIMDEQGKKMSKSVGNVVEPMPLIEQYGSDAVRFFLAKEIPMDTNGKMSANLLEESYNANLANKYGNLVSRTIGMIEKYFDGKLPMYEGDLLDACKVFAKDIEASLNFYCKHMDAFEVPQAMEVAMGLVTKANEYIDITAPWALAKDETKAKELASVMIHLHKAIEVSTWMLAPILTISCPKAKEQIGVATTSVEHLMDWNKNNNVTVKKTENLFARLER